MQTNAEKPKWLQVSQKKRQLQAEAIAPFDRIEIPSNAEFITSINDVSELASLIADGQLKVQDVVLAYIPRYVLDTPL